MKQLLVLLGIVMALLALSKPRVITITAHAQSNIVVPQILATSTINIPAMVSSYAQSYGINPAYASCIVSHESQWDPTKPGDDGNSRGLWQISRVWHPEVSDAVAFSPVSSTLWSLAWIKAGHWTQWSTYWLYCSSTPIF
jgi:hypothetical protein